VDLVDADCSDGDTKVRVSVEKKLKDSNKKQRKSGQRKLKGEFEENPGPTTSIP
jgi:hypothetical protein